MVLDKFVAGIDVILGLDAIDWLGGDTIAKGQMKFRNQYVTKMTNSEQQWYHPADKNPGHARYGMRTFEPILMVTSGQ